MGPPRSQFPLLQFSLNPCAKLAASVLPLRLRCSKLCPPFFRCLRNSARGFLCPFCKLRSRNFANTPGILLSIIRRQWQRAAEGGNGVVTPGCEHCKKKFYTAVE